MGVGTCWLKLGGELWSWNKANMSINNIILGTYWLDWHGTITLTNHTTGQAHLTTQRLLQFSRSLSMDCSVRRGGQPLS